MKTYRYEVTIPKADNQKVRFNRADIEKILRQYLSGYTLHWSRDNSILGYWQGYEDDNAILVFDGPYRALKIVKSLCKKLKVELRQQAIYLTRQPIAQYLI